MCLGDRENGIYFTSTGKVRPTFDGNRIVYVEWAKKMAPCKFRDDFWRPR